MSSDQRPQIHGATLRYWRICAGMSQARLAEATRTAAAAGWGHGLKADSQVAQYERGQAQPRPGTLLALAAALGKRPEDLLGPPPTETPPAPAPAVVEPGDTA